MENQKAKKHVEKALKICEEILNNWGTEDRRKVCYDDEEEKQLAAIYTELRAALEEVLPEDLMNLVNQLEWSGCMERDAMYSRLDRDYMGTLSLGLREVINGTEEQQPSPH